eukprot:CAMPEP_0198611646 /NCGR_PEP_ID=MMETSP1462-20131121/157501_1 /TAXON_ID=1333877 /ORGANISM="Brandtodinium nutriculum, Strain RCC3387" /LENGTH=77 /DNA_ID=CAMNT_0044343451 /DNA_START=420 /DNA_END=653 /DNA_ORIENTATION=+
MASTECRKHIKSSSPADSIHRSLNRRYMSSRGTICEMGLNASQPRRQLQSRSRISRQSSTEASGDVINQAAACSAPA